METILEREFYRGRVQTGPGVAESSYLSFTVLIQAYRSIQRDEFDQVVADDAGGGGLIVD